MRAFRRAVGAEGLDMELDIRGVQPLVGLEKPGSKTGGHGHRAALGQCVLQRDHTLFEQVVRLGVDGAEIGFEDRAGLKMVLQVLAHALDLGMYLDAMRADVIRVANA